MQERSRRTRQRLVRTALQLWTARGFENGIEETTIDEIVTAAGVTKGTFYFHFARKEEILLEMGWETAEVVQREAARCVAAGRPLDDSLRRMINAMVRHVKAAARGAVGRAVAEFRRAPMEELRAFGRLSFSDAFEAVFTAAVSNGELPIETDPVEAAQMFEAVVMETILDWAIGHVDLSTALRRRLGLLLAGLQTPRRSPNGSPDRRGRSAKGRVGLP